MKFFVAFALFVTLTVASAFSVSQKDAQEWQQFKATHNKVYSSQEEEEYRMRVFLENRQKISEHNSLAANGLKSYTLAMNEFGDISHEEFVRTRNGYKGHLRKLSEPVSLDVSDLPKSVDWRDKGYVTPVKDQGQCGSCWAFSATGSLEGQHFKSTGKLVSLSEQNLVDCSRKYGNEGCNGGLMDDAFAYIKDNKGIDTEESYPYEAKDKKCRFSNKTIGATDIGFIDITPGSEAELTKAIAEIGPISVAIDAGHDSFQFYKKGIYYEKHCSSEDLDHGVLAVGYGVDDKGEEYYIVKNSWGTSWGQKGYLFMAKNKNNHCGIATDASYPKV